MNDSFIAKSMFDVLAARDRGLADRFLAIQKRALTDWIPLMRVDMGSHAGLVHLINVGRNVDKLIPDDKKKELSSGEIFLLLAAVLFHDIGRILDKKSKPNCGISPCIRDKKKLDISPCTKPEWDHYRISRNLILDIGQEQGLPDTITVKYCALLAYCHGLSIPPRVDYWAYNGDKNVECLLNEKQKPEFRNTSIEPLGTVRIPLLAAVLRIADETENHWTRAVNDRWLKYQKNNDAAPLFKAFRRRVEDVEFSPAGGCVVMHLEKVPEEQDELLSFVNIAQKIEVVLKRWGPELRPLGLDFNRVFYETRGKLWRFEETLPLIMDPKEKPVPMTKVMEKKQDISEDLVHDDLRIIDLHSALVRLSKITMGYQDFTLAAVEAEAGRPLNDRDRWLIERMADWVPWAISVDPVRQRVRVHIKSGTDGDEKSKKNYKETLKKMSEELIGQEGSN